MVPFEVTSTGKTIRNNYVVLGYPSIFIKIDQAIGNHALCLSEPLNHLCTLCNHFMTKARPCRLGCQLRPPPSTPDICKTVQKWLCCPQLYAEAATASTWDPGRNRSDLQFSIVYEWVHIRVVRTAWLYPLSPELTRWLLQLVLTKCHLLSHP